MTKNLLLIFTRNPQLGKCKTRLAATIGDEKALEVYKFLLTHTATLAKDVTAKKQVWYSEEIWTNDVWNDSVFDKKLQKGNDLGERMAKAFKDGFSAGFKRIIIIGSDMYDLNTADIDKAFDCLQNSDFVVGGAEDGGYYLLGMKRLHAKIFENKKWGTATVLTDTLTDLKDEKVFLTETRNDVDIYEDISEIDTFQPFIKHIKHDAKTIR